MRNAVVALLGVIAAVGCARKPLLLSSSVPADQQAMINEDLAALKTLPVGTDPQGARSIMGIGEFSGPALYDFIADRIHYIVGESYDYNSPANVLPPTNERTTQADPNSTTVTIMTNLGGLLFLKTLDTGTVYTLNIDGQYVEDRTPDIGVIKVGPGYFMQWITGSDIRRKASQFIRYATQAHEGTHNKGNKENTAMAHKKCPKGHAYQDIYQCDEISNGAYGVGTYVMDQLYPFCTDCTTSELNGLRSTRNDFKSRILKQVFVDTAPASY